MDDYHDKNFVVDDSDIDLYFDVFGINKHE
jgi:hypothetical protein